MIPNLTTSSIADILCACIIFILGIIHKEKPQEIKTVRIVKRESERRQRDRERNGTLGIPLINIISRRETITEELAGSSNLNEV